MIRILFVCHGNICRSPMAEFIMKKLVKENGIEDRFFIASAATSTEELGNPVYPPARRKLAEHGINCNNKTAVQMKKSDYEKYDHIIAMDNMNIRNIMRMIRSDPKGKVSLLLSFCSENRSVADPWYSGDFDAAYRDIDKGCRAFLAHLIKTGC